MIALQVLPNNMLNRERLVKNAFIDIYFKDDGYLLKLHKHFVDTIISATDPVVFKDYKDRDINARPLNTPFLEGKKIMIYPY